VNSDRMQALPINFVIVFKFFTMPSLLPRSEFLQPEA
jgi:hypothetical protein